MPVNMYYVPPGTPLAVSFFSSLQRVSLDLTDPVKIQGFANTLAVLGASPSPVSYTFYEKVLGIPSKSYIDDGTRNRLKMYLSSFFLTQQLTLRPDMFDGNNRGPYIHLHYNTFGPERNTTTELPIGYEKNKIHLFPKDQYLFWCLTKLDQFARTVVAKYPTNQFQMKFSVESYRVKKLTAEDTFVKPLETDGGIPPMIVVYGSSDPEIMTFLLRGIVYLFKGLEDTIGEMDMNDPEFISPFNLRISPLISYAAGDRSTTLDIMIAIRDGKKAYASLDPPFEIPAWLLAKQQQCSANQDAVNNETLAVLGVKVCENNAPIDLVKLCSEAFDENRKFCFIQRMGNQLLDPFPFYEQYKNSAAKAGRRKRTRRNKKRRLATRKK
jgi:hypothetical protein